MTFKTITVQGTCEDHGEWEVFYVVPDHVTGEEFLYSMEDVGVFCECDDKDNADLIVTLLNKEARH